MPLKETLINPGDNTASVARDLVSDLGLPGAIKACREIACELQKLLSQDRNARSAKRKTTRQRQRQENIVLAAVRMMSKDSSLAEDHEDPIAAFLGELREELDINATLLGEQGRALAESYMLRRRGKLMESVEAGMRASILEDLRQSEVLEAI